MIWLQAIPWAILLCLWLMWAVVVLVVVRLPLVILSLAFIKLSKLGVWTLASLVVLSDLFVSLPLRGLMACRPEYPRKGPQDPTATAPVTGGAV